VPTEMVMARGRCAAGRFIFNLWGCRVRTEQTRYGANQSGLVCGYYFEAGKPGRPITAEEGSVFLTAQQSERAGAFLWLHFNLANAASER
jgi:hypothetical protein